MRVLLIGPDDDARRALHVQLDRAGHPVAAMPDDEAARRFLANGASAPANGHGTAQADLALANLVGTSEEMQKLRAMIEQVARTKSTVLILGESGTGKELVARAVHAASPRRDRRFVAINCAAIPPNLLESELFGHVRGAFTDAVKDRAGLFEEASGGTLFLDEVGELPMPLQAKLLRALQEEEIRRVGDAGSIKVDVRLVAATLRDLADDVAAGRFREDLFYRLNVLPVAIPPLRDRPDDIPLLARYFAERHTRRHNLPPIELDDAATAALASAPWPGNVRELENLVERAVVLAESSTAEGQCRVASERTLASSTAEGQCRVIDRAFLATLMKLPAETSEPIATDDALSIKKATRELEQDLIKKALVATSGNRTNAAKLLEISHRALLYKMKEYGIS